MHFVFFFTLGIESNQHLFVRLWLNETVLCSAEGFWCLWPQTTSQWGETRKKKKDPSRQDKAKQELNSLWYFAWSDRTQMNTHCIPVSAHSVRFTSTDQHQRRFTVQPPPGLANTLRSARVPEVCGKERRHRRKGFYFYFVAKISSEVPEVWIVIPSHLCLKHRFWALKFSHGGLLRKLPEFRFCCQATTWVQPVGTWVFVPTNQKLKNTFTNLH